MLIATRFTAGATPSHATPSEHAVRQVLTLIIGFLVFMSWPPKALKASEAPGAGSQNPSRPVSASAGSRKPMVNELISKHAIRLGIDPDLVHAVIRQESGFNPQAVSPKGAMGLMQLMPGTAFLMGVNDPFDMEQNIEGGIKYLRHCLHRFDGDVAKALAAYNAGPLQVEKYDGCPPFTETRNYVTRVMQAYNGQTPLVEGGSGRLPNPPNPV
jgi:soluble lytic murein transglycosylase-like protein